ncbi:MAG: hypothetical protein Q8N62_03810 [Candidatus Omnitrophota bacterium]|nr:hypothetical protein [Candidatus Omnitrophota bacterium]
MDIKWIVGIAVLIICAFIPVIFIKKSKQSQSQEQKIKGEGYQKQSQEQE